MNIQIKNIVEAANLQKQLFRQRQDNLKQFMQSHKIPPEVSIVTYTTTSYMYMYVEFYDGKLFVNL